ncbi:hypothetical protein VTN00DRAFT_8099 [Thermoascus crustaceus]|uniref:uncharacterized protein n=1 Tax=Thermoascus crustaceus TaxID=5088 RepID=UPI00374274F2
MPSLERDVSRDRDSVVKGHQHSHSESGRSSVPMWDSSDPDRAPPPLPMNPTSPATRGNVSPNIQERAAGLTEKMRENAPSPYTTNPMPSKQSPEKPLLKGQYHKRMQSFQNGDSRSEFRSFLETRSPERPSRASIFETGDKLRASILDIGDKSRGSLFETGDKSKSSLDTGDKPRRSSVFEMGDKSKASLFETGDKTKSSIFDTDKSKTSIDADKWRSSVFDTGDKLRSSIFETGDKSKASLDTGDKLRSSLFDTGEKTKSSLFDTDKSKASLDTGDKPAEKTPNRVETSAPNNGKDAERETPTFRPSNRYLYRPILGENTPTSATMLALQNMQIPGEHGPAHSNSSSTSSSTGTLPSQTFDALSSQILSLTSIATNLQREMAQLSRRSKDNATDLISLKAATNARDEDIRKSLRELASNINSKLLDPDITSSPGSRKSYSIPRIPTPNSFAAAIEREFGASPGPISDGSASIALLEKVLREMATKEGQEKLLELVDEIKSKPTNNRTDNEADKTITKMLEEILNLVKDESGSRALVRVKADVSSETESTSDADKSATKDTSPEQASSFITEEMLDILRRVKKSVVEGGGLTNEVKALVRELRGEVLGMGRDIARKLEAAENARASDENRPRAAGKEEVTAIVESGLAELKEHMAFIIRENRRQSSPAVTRPAVDSKEVYTAVKNALAEASLPRLPAPEDVRSAVDKEDILAAVKEAWETYKPEIELQNFGLERDEILECLSEGLKAYRPQHEKGITYEQVLAAVEEGMKKFTPPPVQYQSSITRDEIIVTIRECLESLEFPAAQLSDQREPRITRDEILSAISEGIAGQNALTSDMLYSGMNREEVVNAVREGLAAHYATTRHRQESNVTKDDVINAINEAFNAQQSAVTRHAKLEPSISREEILNAIAEGLANQAAVTRKNEVNKDEILEVVASGLQEATTSVNFNVGEQIVERLQDLLEDVKNEVKQCSDDNGRDTEQVLDALKTGLDVLRGDVESYVNRATDPAAKVEILKTVKDGFRMLQADMQRAVNEAALRSATITRPNPNTPELLDAMEKEFDHLRQTISNRLNRENASNDKEEILDAIRDITEKPDPSAQILKTVKEQFEQLRETISMSMAQSGSSADKDEIIAALKDSFKALQEETAQKSIVNDNMLPNTGELLDALNDGVDVIRADLEKILDKPSDDSSAEILETLREGLTSLRADMVALREAQKEFKETSTTSGKELILANEKSIGGDIESLKALITQLHVKVEAMEPNPRSVEPPRDALTKRHLDDLLAAVKEVQGSVLEAGTARDMPADETLAKKEDTNVIETLLRNTKAKIDEFAFPGPDEIARPEQVEALEALLRETMESISQLSARMEAEGATKTEIGTLETLMKDIWVTVDELKSKEKFAEDPERVVKADLQTVEAMIFEVKTQLDELKLPDVETLPAKSEIKELSDLLAGFQEKMDAEAELTAHAFEARKVEHGGLAEKIEEARSVVSELREELLSKLDGSNEGLYELKHLLDGLTASAESFSTVENIRELNELISREFERMRSDHEATKLETEERDAAVVIKQEEVRAAIVSELGTKFDEKLAAVMAKYEEAQTALDSKFTDIEHKEMANLQAVTDTKNVADDIKVIIDSMGNSVTEACERMSEDAKAFLEKVDESYTKMEEMHNDMKSHQDFAQEEIKKTSATTQRVETELHEVHPQILKTIKDILMIVSRHYEHSQRVSQDFQMQMAAIPSAITPALRALPAPEPETPEKYDDSQVQEKLNTLLEHAANKYDDSHLREKLDVLLENAANKQDYSEVKERIEALFDQVPEKYDDSHVREKLDALLGQILEKYNDSQIQEKLDALLSQVPEKYDDSHIREKLDVLLENAANKHDDSELKEKLDVLLENAADKYDDSELRGKLDALLAQVPEKYDDSDLREKLDTLLGQVPQKYDDSQLQEKLDFLLSQEKYDDTHIREKLDSLLGQIQEKYNDSQIQEKLDALLLQAPEKYDDSQLQEKLDALLIQAPEKYDDTHIREKLDALLSQEKYDDSQVQDKLNFLLDHAANTSKSMSQMDRLEEIHQQMMETSCKVSEMVATQTRLMEQDHERKKREADEAAVLLERRVAEKERIEAEIIGLKEEKDSLLNMIQALKLEKEDLVRQNKRLSKEVSGLETALEIRQEEMQLMEDRADSLEKRILEGVLDHARSVLIRRPAAGMRRAPSSASTATRASRASRASAANIAKDTSSILSSYVGLALKRRPAKSQTAGSTVSSNAGKERRILSLSNMTGNRGSTDRQTTPAPAANGAHGSLKRSHSVRSNFSRKQSWGTKSSVANKENDVFPEEDEHASGEESDPGTDRQTSYAGTYVDSLLDAGEHEKPAERKFSFASSANGLDVVRPESINEENEQRENRDAPGSHHEGCQTPAADGEQYEVHQFSDGVIQGLERPPKMEDLVLHDQHSDSGLGTDIPSGESVVSKYGGGWCLQKSDVGF